MRLTRRPSICPAAAATCAAGSVVLRCTGRPRRANSVAMAAATVVLPTPPLPIVMMTPRPARTKSSTKDDNDSKGGRVSSRSFGPAFSGSPLCTSFRRAGIPRRLLGRSGTSVTGRRDRNAALVVNASEPRRSRAMATGSESEALKSPFKISRWFRTPMAASSPLVRSASSKSAFWARLTNTSVVCWRSASAATAFS